MSDGDGQEESIVHKNSILFGLGDEVIDNKYST